MGKYAIYKKFLRFPRNLYLPVILVFTFVLLTFMFLPAPSYALLKWEPTGGPWGGHIRKVEVGEDGIIYLATFGGGVFRSTDNGDTWEWASVGMAEYSREIRALKTGSAGYVYASPIGMGVFRSTDSGVFWESMYSNLGDYYINDIAVDAIDKNIIYIATLSSGVYKSTDQADDWEASGLISGAESMNCLATASYESGPSVVYAATNSEGVWRSTDEAENWTRISSGYSAIDTANIFSIACVSSNPDILYVGISGRVHKSINGGQTWEATNINLTANKIDIVPVSPEVLYISSDTGLYKSTDEGISYFSLDVSGEAFIKDLAFDPLNNSVLYVGNYGSGFFKSTNSGASFDVLNTGINNLLISSIDIASVEGVSKIYVAPFAQNLPATFTQCQTLGLFRSTDDGDTWTRFSNFDETRNITRIYAHPASPETLYVGINNETPCLYRSLDGGGTWEGIDIDSKLSLQDIVADPISPEVMYAATIGEASSNVYKSTDYGASWVMWADNLTANNPYVLCAAEGTSETIVFLGTASSGWSYLRIFSREASSAGWERASRYYGSDLLEGPYVWEIAYSPQTQKLYVRNGPYSRLIYGSIYGSSWTAGPRLTLGTVGYEGDIETDPENPYQYYGSSASSLYQYLFSIDENRVPSAVEESYQLPSLNVEFRHIYPNGINTSYRQPKSLWQIKIDPNSDKNSRIVFSTPTGRSVWRAETINQVLPFSPSLFSGSAESVSSIRWSWVDTSNNELGFRLYSYPSMSLLEIMPQGTTTTLESGFSTNTSYSRIVSAYNTAGESLSNDSLVYTLAEVPATPEADVITKNNVVLSWQTNGNPGYTRYEVYISTEEAPPSYYHEFWEYLGRVSTNEFDTASSKTLVPETFYWFKVRGINGKEGDPGGGIPTSYSGEIRIETASAEPSDDTLPPDIYEVKFNDRSYFAGLYGEGDVIFHTPRVSAKIKDKAPVGVTPEGVDKNSVVIKFNDFEFSVPSSALTGDPTQEVYLDYTVDQRLGSTDYLCSIEVKDVAYKRWNIYTWEAEVKVMGDEVQLIGATVAYPTPYKPLSQGDVTISYTLTTNANVSIFMYDVSGQVVMRRNYYAGSRGGQAGYNDITWNGVSDIGGGYVGNGIYVFKIVSEGKLIGTGKLVVFE